MNVLLAPIPIAAPPMIGTHGTTPDSVPGRVLAALRAHGGKPVRPVEIAEELGITSSAAANALRNLTLRGEAVRTRNPEVRNGPGASLYAAAPTRVSVPE